MIDLTKPIQESYSGRYSHCYGCGANNTHGLQIKSHWDGNKAIAQHIPDPKHNGVKDFVYGGLIASLIDCHAMATAAAAVYQSDSAHLPRFVTGELTVRYVNPTPLSEAPLELVANVIEVNGRKVTLEVTLSCESIVTAKGKVVAFELPSTME